MKKEESSSIALSILPKAADVFCYKMLNTFVNRLGIIRLAISAVLIVLSFVLKPILGIPVFAVLLVLGLLNPVVSPLVIWLQASSQVQRMSRTIFVFMQDKISISDRFARKQIGWDELYGIVCSKRQILLYLTPKIAFVIPKSQLDNYGDELMEMIKANSEICPVTFRNVF